MQIIALISQKGGAGKTTLAIALAVAAERAGVTSVLVDLDPQASAAQWSDLREAETPVVTCLTRRSPDIRIEVCATHRSQSRRPGHCPARHRCSTRSRPRQ